MRRIAIFTILLCGISICGWSETVSIRNIVTVQGMQDNPVLGYGIVVGLKGTGDSASGTQTKEILARIANNFGFSLDPEAIKPKNSAIVLVTATIPPFAPEGSRLDISVSSAFDAKSLEGGELIVTPLLGGDNDIYAIAQGKLQTDRNAKSVSGKISQGAIVAKEILHKIVADDGTIVLQISERVGLSAPGVVKNEIAKKYPDAIVSINNNKLVLKLPEGMSAAEFINELNKLSVEIEPEPSVLIDSRSGIVITGGEVTITEAAISVNGMNVKVGSWGSAGSDSGGSVKHFNAVSTVGDLVRGLNELQATPEDIVIILGMLYKNGNLKAKLIIQ